MPKRDSPNYPLCRHTKTNGRLCNSPALTDSAFCRHHQKLRRTRRTTIDAGPGLSTNVLHPLHDPQSIQLALNLVLKGITTGGLESKAARKMLRVLEMASKQLRQP